MKAFSFTNEKGLLQIGVELQGQAFNFSQAWEIYKEIKSRGKGPSLNLLQIMVETDFFYLDTFQEVFQTIRESRPIENLKLTSHFRFSSPIGRPQKIICIGRNYSAHAEELGNVVPDEPIFFSKSPSAITGHEGAIRIPEGVGRVDYEGELAVVIGKRARGISRDRAFDFIAGYTILNDVTARELQKADFKEAKPWFRSKSFDTFCPIGPFLVPKDAIANLADLELEVRVNNERKQFARLAQMLFDVPGLVAYLSRYLTLEPGDVVATGTPEGVGPLRPGDVVECEITQLGTLRNPVQ
ncbi:MAG: fumarylacetoacetate hydrolase family protein [bacterium]